MLNVLDLFSGIGGFSLGLEATGGFRTVAFCEIDEDCRFWLRKRWPHAPIHDDVRTFGGVECDVICGGFPCQDVSNSGTRQGLAGERSGLWREFARLIGELRPRYVIVENAAALTVRGLLVVLGDLAALGFDAEWHCIPASAVGADHVRDRTWIVAYPTGFRQSGQGPLVQSLTASKARFREAASLVAAFQRKDLPYVCGRHDGLPARMGKPMLTALGNAVVPEIPYQIGRAIMKAEGK